MATKFKRVLAIGDFHCGHVVGLTHPDYNPQYKKNSVQQTYSDVRSEYWKFFAETVDSLRPIDIVIDNGDNVDGDGRKSGGTELLTTDRNRQADMAISVLKYINAPQVFMSYGTPYHTGDAENIEDIIATGIGARKIGDHDWINVNGVVFDYRHHINGSQSPTGRHAALSKERVWNLLWSEWGEYPKADIYLRSHVHYHVFAGGYKWLGMTLPALQGYGSRFGARRMSGTVDFGLTWFDVVDKEDWTWGTAIMKSQSSKPIVYRA